MEHLEFVDHDHFENEYRRKWAENRLSDYIDFCWETNFDELLRANPEGFSDVLFPNIGYTYLINLGTPFVMQLEKSSFEVKTEGFLPRHHYITCHHSFGNRLFGIKFKVCPIVFEKDVDFSEYTELIYPLAYLIDKAVVKKIKAATSFEERVQIVFEHYDQLVGKYEGGLPYVNIVTQILANCSKNNNFTTPIDELSAQYNISTRTLQRYFKATTSFSSKQALQTMRIRQAVIHLTKSPATFNFTDYGYYDYSHFLKYLQQFTGERYFKTFQEVYKNGSVDLNV